MQKYFCFVFSVTVALRIWNARVEAKGAGSTPGSSEVFMSSNEMNKVFQMEQELVTMIELTTVAQLSK